MIFHHSWRMLWISLFMQDSVDTRVIPPLVVGGRGSFFSSRELLSPHPLSEHEVSWESVEIPSDVLFWKVALHLWSLGFHPSPYLTILPVAPWVILSKYMSGHVTYLYQNPYLASHSHRVQTEGLTMAYKTPPNSASLTLLTLIATVPSHPVLHPHWPPCSYSLTAGMLHPGFFVLAVPRLRIF